MHRFFYPKLAASNIKKNGATYLPYLLTCIFTIAIFYIMCSLSLNEGITKMSGTDSIQYMLGLGCQIVSIFSAIFLFYTNSFLMKRRKKEFGLFHILGMEKKHISKVVTLEVLYIAIIGLAAGILLGISLDKVMYLLIMKVLGYEITLGFYISQKAIWNTIILYIVIFIFLLISSVCQIYLAKPIELLQGTNVGEREPKTKWLMVLLGLLCLGGGYSISLFSENPIASIFLFFIAVILVILGTYLLFTAGSIAMLKLLKKNKKYYYQTKHFTSISGMIYRMKQNAVGLSNICILSTMVLVMISATSSMMIGMEDIMNTRYPYDISIYSKEKVESERNEELASDLQKTITESGVSIKEEIRYTYLNITALRNENRYSFDMKVEQMNLMDNIRNLMFIPLSDYNKVTGENKTLSDGEVFVYSNRDKSENKSPLALVIRALKRTDGSKQEYDTIQIGNRTYQIKEQLKEFVGNGLLAANVASTHFIVVKDLKELEYFDKEQKSIYGEEASSIETCFSYNVTGSNEEQIALYNNNLFEWLEQRDYSLYMEGKAAEKGKMISFYGGFFFIGIFLGVLFIGATVLIIYYKQISEGYDDAERFKILQKVGMSREEIKKSIHSQIITVFFLPLITAGLHVTFAFPIIARILKVINLTDTSLFVLCTVGCFLAFSLLYAAIYVITAKAYYRIVSVEE